MRVRKTTLRLITVCSSLLMISVLFSIFKQPLKVKGDVDTTVRNEIVDNHDLLTKDREKELNYYIYTKIYDWIYASLCNPGNTEALYNQMAYKNEATLSYLYEYGYTKLSFKEIETLCYEPYKTEFNKYAEGIGLDAAFATTQYIIKDLDAFLLNGYIADKNGDFFMMDYGYDFNWTAIDSFKKNHVNNNDSVLNLCISLAETALSLNSGTITYDDEGYAHYSGEYEAAYNFLYDADARTIDSAKNFIRSLVCFEYGTENVDYLTDDGFYLLQNYSLFDGFKVVDTSVPLSVDKKYRQMIVFDMLCGSTEAARVNTIVSLAKKYGYFEENYKTPTYDFLSSYNSNFVIWFEKNYVESETGKNSSISFLSYRSNASRKITNDREAISEDWAGNTCFTWCCVPSAISSDYTNGSFKSLVEEPYSYVIDSEEWNYDKNDFDPVKRTVTGAHKYMPRVYYIKTIYGYYQPFNGTVGIPYYYDATKDMCVACPDGFAGRIDWDKNYVLNIELLDDADYAIMQSSNLTQFYTVTIATNFNLGQLYMGSNCFLYYPPRYNKDYYDYTDYQIELLREYNKLYEQYNYEIGSYGMYATFDWNPTTYEFTFKTIEYIYEALDGTPYKKEFHRYKNFAYTNFYYNRNMGTLDHYIYPASYKVTSPIPVKYTGAVATNTPTPVPTKAATATPVPTKAATATPVPTKAATVTPTLTKAPTNTPTLTPTKAPTATSVPTSSPTPTKPATLTPTPTLAATSTLAPTPTDAPVVTPSEEASPTPTDVLDVTPTSAAEITSTPIPTGAIENTPTVEPTSKPADPTLSPTPTAVVATNEPSPTDVPATPTMAATDIPTPTPIPSENNATLTYIIGAFVLVTILGICIIFFIRRKTIMSK